jgi:hypothetical protein
MGATMGGATDVAETGVVVDDATFLVRFGLRATGLGATGAGPGCSGRAIAGAGAGGVGATIGAAFDSTGTGRSTGSATLPGRSQAPRALPAHSANARRVKRLMPGGTSPAPAVFRGAV